MFKNVVSTYDKTIYQGISMFLAKVDQFLLGPLGAAAPFWGPTTQVLSSLSPKRDCSTKSVDSQSLE